MGESKMPHNAEAVAKILKEHGLFQIFASTHNNFRETYEQNYTRSVIDALITFAAQQVREAERRVSLENQTDVQQILQQTGVSCSAKIVQIEQLFRRRSLTHQEGT